ncbi:MAG: CocE/NonD family hydrolase [Lachnospiraceae bacterium]
MADFFTKKEVFQGEEIEAIYRVARKPVANQEQVDLANSEDPMARMGQGFCPAFNQRTYEAAPGIICEQDQAVVMRDGVTIYCDIYRPADSGADKTVPVIVSWSWFGKRPGDGMSEWQIMGVPPQTVSNMAKFESPDPAYWCHQGYAVANVDARGAGHSEGNVHMFTHQDREDGYDFVEWVALLDWCNGKVGMSGNSGVAMHQWGIAAEQPPHLACIAPWECTTDLYRESLYEGGIPALSFNDFIAAQVTGPGGVDDQVAMARKYPFMNGYWADKIPDFSAVKIPVYQTAGMSHFHLMGSVKAFRKCKSRKKWLRIHRDFEWPDTYMPENLVDLKNFYDRYLKDIHNGFEMTPKVRLDVMDAYDQDYCERRAESSFPLDRTEYKKYYFDASNHISGDVYGMSDTPSDSESKVSYDSNMGQVEFDYQFTEDTELSGYMMVHMYVESDGYDDLDMFINVQKADADGNWIPWFTLNEPHPGAWGKIRASRRELDKDLSTKFNPVLKHTSDQKLAKGEIVPVDVAIVPSARFWHKGEKLRVQIAGRYVREGWFEPLSWDVDNKGNHVIHTGGQYKSYIQVPFIGKKYLPGDFISR